MTTVFGRFPEHPSGAAPLPMRDRWPSPLESGTLLAMDEESEFARWLRRFEGSDPEIVAAMHEIDLDLLRWGLCLSPWQRLRATSTALQTLARFRRVATQASGPRSAT